jgi:malonyl-CoA reductase/3-hydroxypropionate dehydrogenase (NADP+)
MHTMSMEASSGKLTGKVAIITGGAGNIGRTITRRYLEEGATVVIADLFEQPLQEFSQELVQQDGYPAERVLTSLMDGSDINKVRSSIEEIIGKTGRIDVLVNNAGSPGPRQRLADIPMSRDELQSPDRETLHDAIGNLLGVIWHPIRAAAPYMQPGSSIINVSTIFSRTDYYGRTAYVVPKAAVNSLSKSMARELGQRGIRVNTIYPGPIDSERIRSVFQSMDNLKGLSEGSTAQEFFDIMALSRPNESGELARGFPKTLDIANTMVFLGSDESAAFAGHSFEVTHGMAVEDESRTTFVSRPGLRNVDVSGKVVLICAGDQVDDVLSLIGLLQSKQAEIVVAFRDRSALSQTENAITELRRTNPGYATPPLLHINPLDSQSADAALDQVIGATGGPHYALILPAHGDLLKGAAPSLAEADDALVERFLADEITGTVALASQLQRHWQKHAGTFPEGTPRVIFMSNGDDGQGNLYADMLRCAIEQLIRNWRHESQLDVETHGYRQVWANQIIRYINTEPSSLDFAGSWAVKLINSDRRIDEINLYLPKQITVATGVRRPSFGWAESLFGLHLGKVALITGGSAGIGGEIGRLLALSGAHIMLAARGEEQLVQVRQSIMEELLEAGYTSPEKRVQYMANIDVADEASLQKLADYTLDTFGRVDFLINNAGISGVEEMVIDIPLNGWQRTLNANLISNYSLIRKIAPSMKAQGSGYILNVSSYFGGEKYVAIPYPNRADYAVSKAGQRAMAESWARFLGPEIQINGLAPGPVDGIRLRGTGERPGLFKRRARLIMENRRLNDLHAALIESQRSTDWSVESLLPLVLKNDVEALRNDTTLPGPMRKLLDDIWEKIDPEASSRSYLITSGIAQKLIQRLVNGGYISADHGYTLSKEPPEPFFASARLEKEARKVGDGIKAMLFLNRMPTEFDVALATVHYLADTNVSGETFHPSGGLRFERTVTEGELFGKASPAAIGRLRGTTVYLIGEHLRQHLTALARSYLNDCDVSRVVLITESDEAAESMKSAFPEHSSSGRLKALASHGNLEATLDRAYVEFGRPGPVVCTPFHPLPVRSLAGTTSGEWDNVISEQEFADLVEHNLTHHFRVAKKISLVDGAQLVLVTQSTTTKSTAEEYALANFIKTSLHAFTATLGVESERVVHNVPVNQVDLARRARTEEPRNADEEAEELLRFVNAVLLTSAPQTEAKESRYRSRIYRGNAITV